MGSVAAQLADYSILTSDNPRNEDPAEIIAEIKKGFGPGKAVGDRGFQIPERFTDIETFAGVRLGPGTLYTAITRLVDKGWIAPESAAGRQRPYRLTGAGAACLEEMLKNMRRVARIGMERLRTV